MRKVSEKCRRALSAILAAAMVLTSAPGTTMTAMAAEQTDAIETVAGSEVNAVDNEASLDGGEKTALEGEGDAGEETPTVTQLGKPEFTLDPSDGIVPNGGEAFFTLTVPENSEVKYVIGDAGQTAAEVAVPTTDSDTYTSSEPAVVVPAPESEAETTVVVKAVAFPAGDNAASYTMSDVASATFTFAAKQTEEPVEPVVVAAPTITFKNGEDTLGNGASVPFGTEVSLELNTEVIEGTETVIYYTTDGTEPSEDSEMYGEAIPLSSDKEDGETITVKAIAVADGNRSEVAAASIVFEAKAPAEAPAAPAITLKNGDAVLESGATVAYGTKVSMELAAQENAAIYYTVDGTNPTTDSSVYNEAVVLSSGKEDGETITVKAVAVADGKTSTVAEASVTFEASVKTVKIDFEGDWKDFSCNLVHEDSDKSAQWKDGSIVANQDSKLHIQITARESFKLKSVLLGKTSQKIVNGKADFRLTAAKDTTITVNTEGILGYTIYDSEGKGLWPKKEGTVTYVISPRAEYRIVAHEGSDEVVFEEANLTDAKNKPYEGDSSVTLSEDRKNAVFSIGTDLAGKTCKVVLKHGKHNSTLIFEVEPILTKVTVAGVRNSELTQAGGEKKSYALTLDPKNSKDEIEVKCTDENGVIDELIVKDGKLSIKTAKKDGNAKITLYNKATRAWLRGGEENDKKAVLCEFTLKVVAPAWTTQKPAVKQTASTDTDVILNITAPRGVTIDNTYYYVISSVQTLSGNSVEGTEERSIYPASAEAYRVRVSGKASDTAKEYEVKVRLVTQDGSTENAYYSQTAVLVCKTKNPYYADKISLKKETTTVYSGQEVVAAAIDFGKNTTYIDGASVEVIEVPSEGRFATWTEYRNGKTYVILLAYDNTTPGRYTLKVTAKADDGMMPATATLPITVVAGINFFDAVGSTKKILVTGSADGKADITVKYDDYNTRYKPKNAKFIYTLGRMDNGWFVEDAYPLGKNARNKSYVTVSSKGAVTVDKSYSVKPEDESANTFAVQVKANDYENNPYDALVQFTVVKDAQTLGRLVLLGEDDTVVLDKDAYEFKASALDGAHIAVLATDEAAVGDDGRYAAADLVDSDLYNVSVKGKGITADKDGTLTVTNPEAKNITITATTKDGGKKTASLKIGKITYDDVSGKKVRVVWTYHEGETDITRDNLKTDEEAGEPNKLEIGRALNAGDEFDLQIVYNEESVSQVAINKFQNYSISVSGGAKVLRDYAADDPMLAKNQMVSVMLTDTAKPIKVTLKQGRTKINYTLKAVVEKEHPAPTVKLDQKQTLVAGKKADQKLTFTVSDKDIPEGAFYLIITADHQSEEFLSGALKDIEYADNKITVVFREGMPEKAGSANVYFVMNVCGEKGDVSRSKLSKPVKITAVNMKKSFKLVDKYKMSAVDARNVPVAYKGTGIKDVTVRELYNANEKGRMNDFTDVIGIGADGESLELKQRISDRKLTGYAEIEVTYDDDKQEVITSRITVTIPKEGAGVNSYKASKITVGDTMNPKYFSALSVWVTAGGKQAKVVSVMSQVKMKDSKTKNYVPADDIAAYVGTNGIVNLDITKAVEGWMEKGKKVDLQVDIALENGFKEGDGGYTFTTINVQLDVKKGNSSAKEALVAPEIALNYEGEAAENEAAVRFTVTNMAQYTHQGKVFYTTDGTEPSYSYEFNEYGELVIEMGENTSQYYGYDEYAVNLNNPAGDGAGQLTIKAIAVPIPERSGVQSASKCTVKEVKWAAAEAESEEESGR